MIMMVIIIMMQMNKSSQEAQLAPNSFKSGRRKSGFGNKDSQSQAKQSSSQSDTANTATV